MASWQQLIASSVLYASRSRYSYIFFTYNMKDDPRKEQNFIYDTVRMSHFYSVEVVD